MSLRLRAAVKQQPREIKKIRETLHEECVAQGICSKQELGSGCSRDVVHSVLSSFGQPTAPRGEYKIFKVQELEQWRKAAVQG